MQRIFVREVDELLDFAASNLGGSFELDGASWNACSRQLKGVFDHPDQVPAAFVYFAGVRLYRPMDAAKPDWLRLA